MVAGRTHAPHQAARRIVTLGARWVTSEEPGRPSGSARDTKVRRVAEVFYWVLKTIVLGPILRALFRPWVRGIEHVPDSGPAILVSNHLSFSDSFFLPLVVPRRITFLAKADYFTGGGIKGRLTAGFFRGVGQVPVDRSGGEASEAALRAGLKVLGTGNLLGIYPEGTRSPDGRLYRGKTGVARMALEGKVPVLPVVMVGTDKVQPIGSKVPTIKKVGVIIGAPLDFSRYEGMESDRLVLRSITDEIMYELMRLSGQEYVDVYAATMKEQLAEAVRDRLSQARTRAQAAAASAAARAADARAKVEAAKLDASKGEAPAPHEGDDAEPEAEDDGLTVDLDAATPSTRPPRRRRTRLPVRRPAGGRGLAPRRPRGRLRPAGSPLPGRTPRMPRDRDRDLRLVPTDLGFTGALWRAVDVFRAVSVVYAAAAYLTRPAELGRPAVGWLVLALMAAWTAFVWVFPRRPAWLVVGDLAVACLAVLASVLVDDRAQVAATNTLPLTWPAAAVLAWAVWRGAAGGVVAALVVGAADLVVISPITRMTLHNIVLLLLAGAVVGYACTLYERSRRELAAALESAAAAKERERLARDIHDSVLQVLAFVQRRGAEIGGEAADLGQMAAEQESLLRGLVSWRPTPSAAPSDSAGSPGTADVLGLLSERSGPGVHVSGPAGPVLLPTRAASDLAAAAFAALDNVRTHAGQGAQAWVLVEDEGDAVVVTVRDDGVGFVAGPAGGGRRGGADGGGPVGEGPRDRPRGNRRRWTRRRAPAPRSRCACHAAAASCDLTDGRTRCA